MRSFLPCMKTYLQNVVSNKRIPLLLIVSFILFFYQAIAQTWHIFISPEFYFNGLAFLLICSVFSFTLLKHQRKETFIHTKIPFFLLMVTCFLYCINLFVTKLSIVSPMLLFLGAYALFGFFIDYSFWKKSVFVFLLLIFTLPVLERLQRFLGFPIRLLTAEIVSNILQFLGISTISNATVIMTENNAANIDLPCSGVKSIYTGSVFMLTVYYLQQVKLSLKLLFITVIFFISLIFFNTWRVFSLVYMYNTQGLQEIGDIVHVLLGIIGFLASCYLLWFLITKYTKEQKNTIKKESGKKSEAITSFPARQIAIAVLILLFTINTIVIKNQPIQTIIKENHTFTLQTIPLTYLPFSKREAGYFETNDVQFGKKFVGKTGNGIPFTLLIVSSKSAKTHHDPEICLQGLGYTINDSKVVQINSFLIRNLQVNDTNQVLYWFVGKDKNILDYSERVWEEIRHPNNTWVLVEIAFTKEVDLNDSNIQNLISEVNTSIKSLVPFRPS